MANKSQVAEQALALIGQLYDIEREVKALDAEQRQAIRQAKVLPVLDALHEWMVLTRQKVRRVQPQQKPWITASNAGLRSFASVSYTHLTLPTSDLV